MIFRRLFGRKSSPDPDREDPLKITQEVRDFAAKQNSESYLAATAPVEGAEEGMEDMAAKYGEAGDLYLRSD